MLEKYITAENTTVRMHFRLVGKKCNLRLDDFEHLRNEIIVDNYFQIEPICCVQEDDWPKTRQTITTNCGGRLETKNSFHYKGKTTNHQNKVGDIISYNVTSNNSLFELTEHIFNRGRKAERPTHQEYFATTIIMRQIFQHKTKPNVLLHIGNLSLGQKLFYLFGKLVVMDHVTQEEISDLFNKLNPSDSVMLIPANTPVMVTLLHTEDESSELLEKVKVHYHVEPPSFSRSISVKLFLVDEANVDKELINHFNMLCLQDDE